MEKGKSYDYNHIEAFANENGYNIEEYGKNAVGNNFLALTHDYKDIVISFVLVGSNSRGYIYECIYSDI